MNEFKEVDVDSEAEAMEVNIGKIIQQEEAVEAITQQFSLAWISLKKVFCFFCLICIKQSFQITMVAIIVSVHSA